MKTSKAKLAVLLLLAAITITCSPSTKSDNGQSETSITIDTPDNISLSALPPTRVLAWLTIDPSANAVATQCTYVGPGFNCTYDGQLTIAQHSFKIDYYYWDPTYPAPADISGVHFWTMSKTQQINAGANTITFLASDGLSVCPDCYYDMDDPPPVSNKLLLSNYEEIVTYGTNPTKSDSDDDGIPDWWEVLYATNACITVPGTCCTAGEGMNPNKADASCDNDGDGQSNLVEFGVKSNPTIVTTACADSQDNDGDGQMDLADTGCANAADTSENGANICDNGIDDDGDTVTDYKTANGDPGCSAVADASEYNGAGPQCDDGIDNDGDTKVDRGGLGVPANADPGCETNTDTTEANAATWQELAASATGGGISGNNGTSVYPSVALDLSGNPIVAWMDNTSGDHEIYIKHWNGSSWEGYPNTDSTSFSGGGISNNAGSSDYPKVAVDSAGNPVVVWADSSSGNYEIYIKRWNGSAWVGYSAGSADYSGGGLSNKALTSYIPQIALDSSDNPVVVWYDNLSGSNWEIYIKHWNGSAWVGYSAGTADYTSGGISGNTGESAAPSLALDSSNYPVVAWFDGSGGDKEIYVKRWDGGAWADIGTASSSGGGISNNSANSYNPSIDLDSSGNPVVSWEDLSEGTGEWEIYIKHWNGSSWIEYGAASASGGGISNNSAYSGECSLALDTSNNPVVAWQDDTNGDREIYIKRWNGSAWVDIGTASSSLGGISNNSGASWEPSLVLDSSDNPVVDWHDNSNGNEEIYLKRFQP